MAKVTPTLPAMDPPTTTATTSRVSDITMDVDQLHADPNNRRRHTERNVTMVADALRDVGAARSIVVDEDDVVLAGNGVVEGAKQAGLTKVRIIDADGSEVIAVRRRGLTAAQKRALAIYDNRTAELAEWNPDQLRMDADAGLDLQPFFTDAELQGIIGTTAKSGPDPDTVPVQRPTTIQVGDLFALGPHRLLCGDCTKADDVDRVMAGDRAALCFTSPPYTEQRQAQYGGIPEDDYVRWFGLVQAAMRNAVADTGHFVINIKPHASALQRRLYVFDLVVAMVRDWSWLFVDEFCWLRTGIPQQVVHRFKNAFEPVYWFAASEHYRWFPEAVKHASDAVPIALGPGAGDTNAAKRQGKGGGAIQGNTVAPGFAYPSNVLDFKQNAAALGHPAAFPVQLPLFFLACMSMPDDVVLDPFGGSGTTIIACEQLQRAGRTIELSPSYCQIIIDRWETFTGSKAVQL